MFTVNRNVKREIDVNNKFSRRGQKMKYDNMCKRNQTKFVHGLALHCEDRYDSHIQLNKSGKVKCFRLANCDGAAKGAKGLRRGAVQWTVHPSELSEGRNPTTFIILVYIQPCA